MSDSVGFALAKAIKFLGVCLIRAALVHRQPSNFDSLIKIAKADYEA